LEVAIYADGCYSHGYGAAGAGWCLVGFEESPQEGSAALYVPGETYECEFMATYVAVKNAIERYGAATREMSVTVFADNNQVLRSLGGKGVPRRLKELCGDLYEMLDTNFKSWRRDEAHSSSNEYHRLADLLSKKRKREMRRNVERQLGIKHMPRTLHNLLRVERKIERELEEMQQWMLNRKIVDPHRPQGPLNPYVTVNMDCYV
jgi:ribonuclease HI